MRQWECLAQGPFKKDQRSKPSNWFAHYKYCVFAYESVKFIKSSDALIKMFLGIIDHLIYLVALLLYGFDFQTSNPESTCSPCNSPPDDVCAGNQAVISICKTCLRAVSVWEPCTLR